MDPHCMDNCEFDTLSIAPLQQKIGYEINEAPGLLSLVSLLGVEKS